MPQVWCIKGTRLDFLLFHSLDRQDTYRVIVLFEHFNAGRQTILLVGKIS